jgi:hypothetical protein
MLWCISRLSLPSKLRCPHRYVSRQSTALHKWIHSHTSLWSPPTGLVKTAMLYSNTWGCRNINSLLSRLLIYLPRGATRNDGDIPSGASNIHSSFFLESSGTAIPEQACWIILFLLNRHQLLQSRPDVVSKAESRQ